MINLQKEFICNEENVKREFCKEEQIGEFIVSSNASETRNDIVTTKVHLKDPEPLNYPIKRTGYYCVGTAGFSTPSPEYRAVIEFRNAYGELPAAQIAKLPFYGGLTIVYAVIGMLVYSKCIRKGRFTDDMLASGASSISKIAMIYVSPDLRVF